MSAYPIGQISLDNHQAVLEGHSLQMAEIQTRIQRLENRLVYLGRKSRMDPKGFRRDSAKRMLAHFMNEMKKIEQKIVWHCNQMRQLQA